MKQTKSFSSWWMALSVTAGLTGCSKPFAVDVERLVPEQRVNGNPVVGVLDALIGESIPLSIDLAQEQAARDACLVQKVYLSSLVFTITATGRSDASDEDNFDFVDDIEIYVASARQDTTLPRVLIAELRSAPSRATTIGLDVTGTDIIDYVEEGARIETSASGSVPADDVTFDGDITITLDLL